MFKLDQSLSQINVVCFKQSELELEIIKRALIDRVNNLIVVKSIVQALELVKSYKPDILIIDIEFLNEDENEMEFVEKIRDFDINCGIIISTKVRDLKQVLKTIDIGIDKYLLGPVKESNIFDAVEEVAKKIICRKFELSRMNYLNEYHKQEVMEKVKSEVSKFMGKTLGKEPSSISININQKKIEISNYGILTLMEESLLVDENNKELVIYNRKVFYNNKSTELEDVLSKVLKRKSKIKKVDIDILENREVITSEFV